MRTMPTTTTHDRSCFPNFKIVVQEGVSYVMTEDLNVAAYLKGILGYEIKDIRPSEGKKGMSEIWFRCIDQGNPQEAANHVADFYNNCGFAGRYLDYTNSWKDMKAMLPHFR